MKDESNYLHWLEVPENKPIKFGDLAHLIADAMWPDRGADDDRMSFGVALAEFEKELRTAAEGGELLARNASTLKRETFLLGAALGRTVVLPQDLGTYLRERGGIGLRLIPHGSGPNHWTIDHAAAAIAAQEGWHVGSRDALRARMLEAATKGELTVRDPRTDLPHRPEHVHDYWDLVSPADVNAWLHGQGALYRWNVLTIREARDVFNAFDLRQPRYADEASNNEYTLGWWNAELGAAMWWALKGVNPKEAATLLCGLNPHDPAADGNALATPGEPDANAYKTRLRWFDDAAQDGAPRTLQKWLDFCIEKGLKHHSWIDEWLGALPSAGAGLTETARDLANIPNGVTLHSTKTKRRDVLTPLIEKAMAQCANGLDVAEVWPKLHRLAVSKEAPFLGGATEEGLQYEDGDQVFYFTRKHLRDRMRRRAKAR